MRQETAGQGNQKKGEVSRNPPGPPLPTNLLRLRSLPSPTRHGWAMPTKGPPSVASNALGKGREGKREMDGMEGAGRQGRESQLPAPMPPITTLPAISP